MLTLSTALAIDIKVQVTSKKPKQAQLHIELYKLAGDLDFKESWQHTVAIASHDFEMNGDQNTQFFILKNVALGEMCARSFVDVNGNNKLDKSPMGLPKEPVGFANNPILIFGEPLPSEACFEVTPTTTEIHIKLQHKKRNKS
ncbi:MAG: DUF2141 domain-containing protein [Paraglaciecola sp.]|uniref:DUF2141 domain-containing protein n=1 Tax=Paraglaciecola sp. TaxID=1920173 RepID=UPI0032983A22